MQPKREWVELALKYIAYTLRCYGVEPNSGASRGKAEEMELMIGVNALEIARFINALLRGSIKTSFTEKRAGEIAIAWSLVTKTEARIRWVLTPEIERNLIVNGARQIGADPNEAI